MGANPEHHEEEPCADIGFFGSIKQSDPKRYEELKAEHIQIYTSPRSEYDSEEVRSTYIMVGESFHVRGDSTLELGELERELQMRVEPLRQDGFYVWIHKNRRIHSVRDMCNNGPFL